MKETNYTRLSIDVPLELYKVMKFHIIENHLNIKNYVLNLIKEDLSEELEDYLLGQMALQAEKDGYLSVKESAKYLDSIKKPAKSKSSPHKNTNHAKNKTK